VPRHSPTISAGTAPDRAPGAPPGVAAARPVGGGAGAGLAGARAVVARARRADPPGREPHEREHDDEDEQPDRHRDG